MTAKIIDGKTYAEGLRSRIAGHVERLKRDHGITPGLAVVIVGHDPGSQIYVSQKAKQTVEVGMHSEKYELPEDASEAEVLALVQKYKEEGEGFVPKYLDLLAAGGSDAPHVLLAKLGVDVNDPAFWELGLRLLGDMVGQAETLAGQL